MTTISSQNPISSQPPANRAAWREEMLGQLLEQMRERRPESEATLAPKIKAIGKGQFLDVYV
ncbi:MAG: hypothetical protein LBS44_04715 [Deltaproteobacteria bacterium]|jgi:hypothetical protein|nr:hypothetical protein [Deltaproteobacteria bacterium]